MIIHSPSFEQMWKLFRKKILPFIMLTVTIVGFYLTMREVYKEGNYSIALVIMTNFLLLLVAFYTGFCICAVSPQHTCRDER